MFYVNLDLDSRMNFSIIASFLGDYIVLGFNMKTLFTYNVLLDIVVYIVENMFLAWAYFQLIL